MFRHLRSEYVAPRLGRLYAGPEAAGVGATTPNPNVTTLRYQQLRDAMRRLWSDHVVYTRNFILSAVAGTPDRAAVTDRLMRNQDDLGAAFASFYGPQAGRQLAQLLREHIQIAADLTDAVKNNQLQVADGIDQKWHQNADQLAMAISQLNPGNWDFPTIQRMLYDHLRLTKEEAGTQIAGDWKRSIATFDQVYTQAMHMADGFVDGLARQFGVA